MDTALDKALKEKAELEERLRKLHNYIEIHRELFGDDSEQQAVENNKNKPRRRVRPGMGAMVKKAAIEVIREAGRPLQRGELTDRIQERVTIESADPANYVSTVIYRDDDTFEKIDGRGYWLKGVALPSSGQGSVFIDLS